MGCAAVWRNEGRHSSSQNPCGSGLARDGGVSVTEEVEGAGLIAGKPAPTGIV
ncbi:hypothetical protein PMm318_A04680 [Pseudomonas moorei]